MPQRKIRVALLYGGRSSEHEVSLQSAASVARHLDPARFELVAVAIDRDGLWRLCPPESIADPSARALPVVREAPAVLIPPPAPGRLPELVDIHGGRAVALPDAGFDVVFPVVHGPYGEDGTLQGFLELADVPYVGSGVLASAMGMDKDIAKRLAAGAGIAVVPYRVLRSADCAAGLGEAVSTLGRQLGFPLFVKPANLGSSVGVHKARGERELEAALQDAFRYDHKVLVEKAVAAREIELSVLESPRYGAPPDVSVPGEVIPTHEFYSYEAKYLDENGAALEIPAKLTSGQRSSAQDIAARAFRALECEGMARVDLFLDRDSGEFYFNELNTIPGFTTISMYPKLWAASGLAYGELLSRLIELAFARHRRRQALKRDR